MAEEENEIEDTESEETVEEDSDAVEETTSVANTRRGLRFIFDDFPEDLGIMDSWHCTCLSTNYWGVGKIAVDKNGNAIYKNECYFETIPAMFSYLIQEITIVSTPIDIQMSDAMLLDKIDLMANLINVVVSKMNRASSIFGVKIIYDIDVIREKLGRSEADWLEASIKRFDELKKSEKRFSSRVKTISAASKKRNGK